MHRYASFMHSFVGRGVCECFPRCTADLAVQNRRGECAHDLSSLPSPRRPDAQVSPDAFQDTYDRLTSSCHSYYTILYVCGAVVGIVGLAYIALNFFPMFEAPS